MYAKIWRKGIDIVVAFFDEENDNFISSDVIAGIQAEGVVFGKPLETDPLKLAIDRAKIFNVKRMEIDLS